MVKVSVFLFLCMMFLVNVVHSAGYMGIILDETTPEDCRIVRGKKSVGCESRVLYVGDRIQINPSMRPLNIRVSPFVELISEGKGSLLVIPKHQDIDKGCIKSFIDNFIGKEEHFRALTAVRGTSKDIAEAFLDKLPVTPPPIATVLPNVPIVFRWRNGEGEELIIEDLSKEIIYSRQLKGLESLLIAPAEMGLVPGQEYVWYYRGDILEDRYSFSVLKIDKQTMEPIDIVLRDLGGIKDVEDAIVVSATLQAISDTSEDFDFYWLSYQVLPRKFHGLDQNQKTRVLNLMNRYYERFRRMN